MKAKTESEIGEKQRGKKEKRSLYINESFNNIKTVKLFGWEPDFIKKVDEVFQEEMAIEDTQHMRQKIYDFIEGLMSKAVTITVFGTYVYLGNTLTI